MKRYNRVVVYMLLLVLAMALVVTTICETTIFKYAQAEEIEEKEYSEIDMNSNFCVDSILVVLDKNESKKFKNYSPKDFYNIDCVQVCNLMKDTSEKLQKQIETKTHLNKEIAKEKECEKHVFNLEQYRSVLMLKLNTCTKEDVANAIDRVMKVPGVKSAEPNYIDTIESMHPNNGDLKYQWAIENIQLEKAWNLCVGSSSIVVGVMDTGIDSSHPDLVNRINNNKSVDCLNPENVVADPNPTDPDGHGTHVAGIIGAQGVANGVTGVCRDIRLASLRVFDSTGAGSHASVIAAIDYANNNGISILNYSGGGKSAFSNALKSSLINYSGLLVCAAGNEDRNNDDIPHYPSQYAMESNRIISVGAIKNDNTRPSQNDWGYDTAGNPVGSNYGALSVDLFAPGDEIISTVPTAIDNSGYKKMSGTSMATPYVTGVAALLKSCNRQLSAEQIKTLIVANVDDVSGLHGLCVSNGKLNARKALVANFSIDEPVSWYGYEGESFYWKGKVNAYYENSVQINNAGQRIIEDNTCIIVELETVDAYNLVLSLDGMILFTLRDSAGALIQAESTNVSVNLLNKTSISQETFIIDARDLDVGTYNLTINSNFTRGPSYSESHTFNYSFAVQRPVEAISNFGYLSSWYQWKGEVLLLNDALYSYSKDSSGIYLFNNSTTLNFKICTGLAFNAVREITGSVTLSLKDGSGSEVASHYCEVRVGLASNVTLSNDTFSINTSSYLNDTYTLYLSCTMTRAGTTLSNSASYSFIINRPSPSSCITTGSLITLADGTQTAVESLTGNEQLLVWDMLNGTFTSAPILFMDIDPTTTYEVITLTFSDGTTVNVIDEHAFFDITLNKYVFLRSDTSQYIGHYFIKQVLDGNNNMIQTIVQLIEVSIEEQITTAYSPVTYGHLCYYVNGMLSMPGNTESFINIFEVDPTTMSYDEDAMEQDIATYGLYTYEEFNNIIPLPQIVFDAFNGQYLKVAIGKGITTLQEIQALLNRYSVFFV